MEASDKTFKKADIIAKLDSVPQELLERVSEFIDGLLAQKNVITAIPEVTEISPFVGNLVKLPEDRIVNEDWDKWQEWFAERDWLLAEMEPEAKYLR